MVGGYITTRSATEIGRDGTVSRDIVNGRLGSSNAQLSESQSQKRFREPRSARFDTLANPSMPSCCLRNAGVRAQDDDFADPLVVSHKDKQLTPGAKTHEFQAEVSPLMDIIINSL